MSSLTTRNYAIKLNEAKEQRNFDIRVRVAAGETPDEIAKTYDISVQRVHQIVFGRKRYG